MNALRALGVRVSEQRVARYSETTQKFGTSERGIIDALRAVDATAIEFHSSDRNEAYRWLQATLTSGKPVILCVENWEHWIVAIGTLGDRIVIVDSANFKRNVAENGCHVWSKRHLLHQWWNDRVSIDDDTEHRLYGIEVGIKKR